MSIYLGHRQKLEKYWIQRGPCRYPTHRGCSKTIKNWDVVNLKMAKEILKFHGMVVPIGSGESVTKFSLLYLSENQIYISRIFDVVPLKIALKDSIKQEIDRLVKVGSSRPSRRTH